MYFTLYVMSPPLGKRRNLGEFDKLTPPGGLAGYGFLSIIATPYVNDEIANMLRKTANKVRTRDRGDMHVFTLYYPPQETDRIST